MKTKHVKHIVMSVKVSISINIMTI